MGVRLNGCMGMRMDGLTNFSMESWKKSKSNSTLLQTDSVLFHYSGYAAPLAPAGIVIV